METDPRDSPKQRPSPVVLPRQWHGRCGGFRHVRSFQVPVFATIMPSSLAAVGAFPASITGSAVIWIAAATALAAAIGWVIVRASPPLLPQSPDVQLTRSSLPRASDRTGNFAVWFILMRWIAVLCAATLVTIVVMMTHLLPDEVWWPLVLTIALLAACNAGYIVLLKRGWPTPKLLVLQVYLDLVLLTLLLHFSGGIENPLSLLMLLHVIIGGIVLSRRQCYGVAAGASILIASLAALEGYGVVDHYTLEVFPHEGGEHGETHAALHPLFAVSSVGLQTAFFFLTAFFVSQLASRLRHDESRLELMAERALAERQLLERSLDTTGTALRVLDERLRPALTNRRWHRWFAAGGEAEGIRPLLDDEESALRRTQADGGARVTEIRDGCRSSPRTFQVTTARLSGTGETPGSFVELVQDITTQKDAQAQILRAGRLAAVGELAGHVAHEVNNPIAIISGKARLLLSRQRTELGSRVVEELEKIVELCDRVARIAQRLLSSSRPSGAVHQRVDLRSPLEKVLEMVDDRIGKLGILVEERIPDSIPPVTANPYEVEQIILNLVLNAVDAMPAGGRLELEILYADGPEPTVSMSIRDTGSGIEPSIRERIFDPFFSTKERGRGTGLGLPICRQLAESNGGTLELVGASAAGSHFQVVLPAAEAETGSDE